MASKEKILREKRNTWSRNWYRKHPEKSKEYRERSLLKKAQEKAGQQTTTPDTS